MPAAAKGNPGEAAIEVATGASLRTDGTFGPMGKGLVKRECLPWLGEPDVEANGFKGFSRRLAGAASKTSPQEEEEEENILEGFAVRFPPAIFTFETGCAGRRNPETLMPLLGSKAATLPKQTGPIV